RLAEVAGAGEGLVVDRLADVTGAHLLHALEEEVPADGQAQQDKEDDRGALHGSCSGKKEGRLTTEAQRHREKHKEGIQSVKEDKNCFFYLPEPLCSSSVSLCLCG